MRPGSARLLVLVAVLFAALLPPAARAPAAPQRQAVFAGLGTWLPIPIYARKAWRDPETEVAAMARDGVRTLYLETGNYRQKADLVRPDRVARFVDAAHAAGLRIVAWYLPSFANLARDERRALAAIDFRTASGGHFDGFSLDIEATVVRGIPLRNRRLLALSSRLRRDAGPRYALGAITPSPIGMSPSYWPGIPYRRLTRFYDAFLPMAYSTLRGDRGTRATLSYLTATVASIRARSGDPNLPVHLIGGLSGGMGVKETAGFMDAVGVCSLLGYSVYPFPQTRPAAWAALAAPPARIGRGLSCG